MWKLNRNDNYSKFVKINSTSSQSSNKSPHRWKTAYNTNLKRINKLKLNKKLLLYQNNSNGNWLIDLNIHLGNGISETALGGFFVSCLSVILLHCVDGEYVKLILCLLLQEDSVPKPLEAVGETQLLPISLLYFMFVYSLPVCRDF